MASRQLNVAYLRSPEPSVQSRTKQMVGLQCNVSRRIGVIATFGSDFLARQVIWRPENVYAMEVELEMQQTIEEVSIRIREYEDSLKDVKAFLEVESWKDAQKVLRKSSTNLKLDLYTFIQTKPGSERPLLRQLYFNLFNNVTKLDYAARDKDASRVSQCYGNIVAAYNDILSKL
ncbi:PsbQ-like 3 [Euphorbia peplus]|nr:PsbQ-like 3 [Euphorbia peplus]